MKIYQYWDYQDKHWFKRLLCTPEIICEIEADSITQADCLFEKIFTPTLEGKPTKVSALPIAVSILDNPSHSNFQKPPYTAKKLSKHLIGLPHPVINWWEVGLSADDKIDLKIK